MPHVSLTPREFEERNPSMRAPDDDRMEDILKDEDDMVFKHGMEIADEIRAAMKAKGRTRYRAPLDGGECGYRRLDEHRPSRTSHVAAMSGECGYRRLGAHRPSRTSHVAAIDDLECGYIGLLSESMTSVAGPRAAVPRDTSHEETYGPNIEKRVGLHHPAGLTSSVRQACSDFRVEGEVTSCPF